MKKIVFTIIITVLGLTFLDYYSAFTGSITKDQAIYLIDGRITTMIAVLLILLMFRKNIHYKDNKTDKVDN